MPRPRPENWDHYTGDEKCGARRGKKTDSRFPQENSGDLILRPRESTTTGKGKNEKVISFFSRKEAGIDREATTTDGTNFLTVGGRASKETKSGNRRTRPVIID